MWGLFHPVDSIIDSLLIFLLLVFFLVLFLQKSTFYHFHFVLLLCLLCLALGGHPDEDPPQCVDVLESKHNVCFSSDLAYSCVRARVGVRGVEGGACGVFFWCVMLFNDILIYTTFKF